MLVFSPMLLAQHPAPIAINDTTVPAERFAFDARMSPDGTYVAYSATSPTGAGQTRSLFIRRADGTSASATLVTQILTNAIPGFSPYIPFTWRHVLGTSKLVFGERIVSGAQTGGYNLKEFDPGTGLATQRASFAPPVAGTNFLFLQLHPCKNLVSGVLTNFQLPTTLDKVWFVNLNGGAVTYPPGATATGQLIAADFTPNEQFGIFMEHPSNADGVWQYSTTTLAVTQVANAKSSATTGGCLDDSTVYGIDRPATNDLAAWSLPPQSTNVPIRREPVQALEAAASPTTLVTGTPKDFLVLITGTNELHMTPSTYGGEIVLSQPLASSTGFREVSCDAAAAKVVAISTGVNSRVWVFPTNREVRATFSHPPSAPNVTYNVVAPCDPNEIVVLATSLTLTATPTPWGPPGSGQNDLDNPVVLGFNGGAPFVYNAQLAANPAFLGVVIFYQAFRVDPTAAPLNSTRAAGVRYF